MKKEVKCNECGTLCLRATMAFVDGQLLCKSCFQDEDEPCKGCHRVPCDCDRQYDDHRDRQMEKYDKDDSW